MIDINHYVLIGETSAIIQEISLADGLPGIPDIYEPAEKRRSLCTCWANKADAIALPNCLVETRMRVLFDDCGTVH